MVTWIHLMFEYIFKPTYVISNWIETFALRKVGPNAILQPTGIGPNFTLTVIRNGSTLDICVKFPTPMTNVRESHRLLFSKTHHLITEHHTSLLEFEESLCPRRTIGDIH